MIYMCLEIEKFETKSFQFFPYYKDKTGISDIENYLSKYNSKTCD